MAARDMYDMRERESRQWYGDQRQSRDEMHGYTQGQQDRGMYRDGSEGRPYGSMRHSYDDTSRDLSREYGSRQSDQPSWHGEGRHSSASQTPSVPVQSQSTSSAWQQESSYSQQQQQPTQQQQLPLDSLVGPQRTQAQLEAIRQQKALIEQCLASGNLDRVKAAQMKEMYTELTDLEREAQAVFFDVSGQNVQGSGSQHHESMATSGLSHTDQLIRQKMEQNKQMTQQLRDMMFNTSSIDQEATSNYRDAYRSDEHGTLPKPRGYRGYETAQDVGQSQMGSSGGYEEPGMRYRDTGSSLQRDLPMQMNSQVSQMGNVSMVVQGQGRQHALMQTSLGSEAGNMGYGREGNVPNVNPGSFGQGRGMYEDSLSQQQYLGVQDQMASFRNAQLRRQENEMLSRMQDSAGIYGMDSMGRMNTMGSFMRPSARVSANRFGQMDSPGGRKRRNDRRSDISPRQSSAAKLPRLLDLPPRDFDRRGNRGRNRRASEGDQFQRGGQQNRSGRLNRSFGNDQNPRHKYIKLKHAPKSITQRLKYEAYTLGKNEWFCSVCLRQFGSTNAIDSHLGSYHHSKQREDLQKEQKEKEKLKTSESDGTGKGKTEIGKKQSENKGEKSKPVEAEKIDPEKLKLYRKKIFEVQEIQSLSASERLKRKYGHDFCLICFTHEDMFLPDKSHETIAVHTSIVRLFEEIEGLCKMMNEMGDEESKDKAFSEVRKIEERLKDGFEECGKFVKCLLCGGIKIRSRKPRLLEAHKTSNNHMTRKNVFELIVQTKKALESDDMNVVKELLQDRQDMLAYKPSAENQWFCYICEQVCNDKETYEEHSSRRNHLARKVSYRDVVTQIKQLYNRKLGIVETEDKAEEPKEDEMIDTSESTAVATGNDEKDADKDKVEEDTAGTGKIPGPEEVAASEAPANTTAATPKDTVTGDDKAIPEGEVKSEITASKEEDMECETAGDDDGKTGVAEMKVDVTGEEKDKTEDGKTGDEKEGDEDVEMIKDGSAATKEDSTKQDQEDVKDGSAATKEDSTEQDQKDIKDGSAATKEDSTEQDQKDVKDGSAATKEDSTEQDQKDVKDGSAATKEDSTEQDQKDVKDGAEKSDTSNDNNKSKYTPVGQEFIEPVLYCLVCEVTIMDPDEAYGEHCMTQLHCQRSGEQKKMDNRKFVKPRDNRFRRPRKFNTGSKQNQPQKKQ
ncbi:uncharacterized protein [Ptychodera flava]|uniref:uncharacterized protein n=1 Tax=Ptychodera flava TaxID=63121 RepID=UPI00396A29A4